MICLLYHRLSPQLRYVQFVRFTKVVSFEKCFTIPTYMLDQSFSQCLLSAFFFQFVETEHTVEYSDGRRSFKCLHICAR